MGSREKLCNQGEFSNLVKQAKVIVLEKYNY